MATEIDSAILQAFFRKATLDTKMETARLLTNTNGMTTLLANLPGHVLIESTLKKDAFHKFQENITLDIRDTIRFNRILKSFKDKINVSVKDTFILLSGVNKTAHFKSASEVENFKESGIKLAYDVGVEVPMTFIKELGSNITNVDADCIELEIKDKKLIATTKGQEDTIVEQMPADYKDCKFIISAEYFNQIFNILDSQTVTLSFQNLEVYDEKRPIQIKEKGKTHSLKIWVAPFIKEVE